MINGVYQILVPVRAWKIKVLDIVSNALEHDLELEVDEHMHKHLFCWIKDPSWPLLYLYLYTIDDVCHSCYSAWTYCNATTTIFLRSCLNHGSMVALTATAVLPTAFIYGLSDH